MRSVWIVEGSYESEITGEFGAWHSTVGVALNREDGRARLKRWKHPDSPDRYRLVRYVPAARAAEGDK